MTELRECDLHEWLIVDANAGILRWRKSPNNNKIKAGELVGRVVTNGYLRFKLRGRSYAVHSVIFAMCCGRWPIDQIDHINCDKADNRIDNLREATNRQNAFNRPSLNRSTGQKGVSLHRGRFIARIKRDGASSNLGSFDTLEAAKSAYDAAAMALHGDFMHRGSAL